MIAWIMRLRAYQHGLLMVFIGAGVFAVSFIVFLYAKDAHVVAIFRYIEGCGEILFLIGVSELFLFMVCTRGNLGLYSRIGEIDQGYFEKIGYLSIGIAIIVYVIVKCE